MIVEATVVIVDATMVIVEATVVIVEATVVKVKLRSQWRKYRGNSGDSRSCDSRGHCGDSSSGDSICRSFEGGVEATVVIVEAAAVI